MLNLRQLTYVSPLNSTAMAIVQNMWLKKTKKRLGGTVLYQAMEQTRQRELAVSVSNPRTASQMKQRVKWANLVNFYRGNREWMKYAFETKTPQQSEYNKFMSVNVAASNIYLTKTLAGMGSCVVAPYIVTQGSLTPIELTANTGFWASNIWLAEGFTIDSATTVAAFTNAVLGINPALRSGDQLSFIRFTQMSNADTGAPYMVVRRYEVILSTSDISLLSDYFPIDYIDSRVLTNVNTLCVEDSGNAGGFALILSRTIGGKTYVSTQKVIIANNAATISAFSSASALESAIQSYGEGSDAFLSSNTAEEVSHAPVVLSLIGITKDGVSSSTGSQVSVGGWHAGDILGVNFNAPVEATQQVSAVVVSNGTTYNCATTLQAGRISITLPQNFTALPTEYLRRVVITLDDVPYQGTFQVPDSGGDSGDAD